MHCLPDRCRHRLPLDIGDLSFDVHATGIQKRAIERACQRARVDIGHKLSGIGVVAAVPLLLGIEVLRAHGPERRPAEPFGECEIQRPVRVP